MMRASLAIMDGLKPIKRKYASKKGGKAKRNENIRGELSQKQNQKGKLPMLEPFKGELLLHPAGLDYCANHCSNNCAYCFANARDAARSSSPKSLIDMIYGRSKGAGLTNWLYQQGYPICISNRTDPLATSNFQDTLTVFTALNDSPNGVFIQTKGSRAGHSATLLDKLTKCNVAFYVTVTSRREEILDRVEPGAGTYESRLGLIRYAVARGWPVIVGLNPLWKPWIGDDLRSILDDCIAAGARDFVVQPLHISPFALQNMPRQCRERLTADASDAAAFRAILDAAWRSSSTEKVAIGKP